MDVLLRDISADDVINLPALEAKVAQGRPLKGYWGTAPTGRPHVGYLIPSSRSPTASTRGVR